MCLAIRHPIALLNRGVPDPLREMALAVPGGPSSRTSSCWAMKRGGKLARYDWPGNVRELHHVIQLAAALSEGREIGQHEVRAALADARGNGAALSSRDPHVDAHRE